jgi:hypothetical protein
LIVQSLCQSFQTELLNGIHNFTSHTFKIALYTSVANLSATTTAYTTTGEMVGTNYTAGGIALTTVVPALIDMTTIVSFQPAVWANMTGTARGALIYNSSASDAAVMVLDFGFDRTATDQTFTVTFPAVNANDAILRMVRNA